MKPVLRTPGVSFQAVAIGGTCTYALQIQSPGFAAFTSVVAGNVAQAGDPTAFGITQSDESFG